MTCPTIIITRSPYHHSHKCCPLCSHPSTRWYSYSVVVMQFHRMWFWEDFHILWSNRPSPRTKCHCLQRIWDVASSAINQTEPLPLRKQQWRANKAGFVSTGEKFIDWALPSESGLIPTGDWKPYFELLQWTFTADVEYGCYSVLKCLLKYQGEERDHRG